MKNTNTSGIITIEPGQYQSVAGYARANNLSRVAVLKQIWTGKLPAVQVGRAWIVRLPVPESNNK